ncbi:MAG: metal-dependent hydrolase [Chloroflexi bacterium]|nr:metal-dependent hydrolase [Chloroflexota bacterium]
MKRWGMIDLRLLVLYSSAFAILSFLFSLSAWGRITYVSAAGPTQVLGGPTGIIIHMGEHVVLGALAALPTRNVVAILACMSAAVLVDVDHVGAFVNLPIGPRASHSIAFALLATLVIFFLARKGVFGGRIRPLVLGSIALASVLAHLSLDAVVGDGYFPMWMPFSYEHVFIPPFGGALLEVLAIGVVWAAVVVRPWRARNGRATT